MFLVCHLALLLLRQSISLKVAANRQVLLGGKLGRPSMINRIVLVIQGRAHLIRSRRSSSHLSTPLV
jgi:hypothetical protein